MGFSPVQQAAIATGVWTTSGLGSVTVALPSALADGDLVVVFIYSNNLPGAFTPPSGYAISGSRIDFNGGSNAIYTHVWHTGDPTSVVFTSVAGSANTAWLCCLARSKSAASIVSHTTNVTVVNSLNCPFTSFPPTRVGDLRLGFMTSGPVGGGGLGSLTSPAVTPTDANMGGVKFREAVMLQNGGLSAAIWYSLNEDPSGADANTQNWTSPSSTVYCTRSLVLDDGSSDAPGGAIEVPVFLADPAITAHSIEGGPDGLSSAAGVFGGGAHIL